MEINRKRYELTSCIFLLGDILHKLRVHSIDGHEQGLYGGIVGDTAAPLMIAPHTVTEYLYTRTQGIQKLAFIFTYFTVLETLSQRKGIED